MFLFNAQYFAASINGRETTTLGILTTFEFIETTTEVIETTSTEAIETTSEVATTTTEAVETTTKLNNRRFNCDMYRRSSILYNPIYKILYGRGLTWYRMKWYCTKGPGRFQ